MSDNDSTTAESDAKSGGVDPTTAPAAEEVEAQVSETEPDVAPEDDPDVAPEDAEELTDFQDLLAERDEDSERVSDSYYVDELGGYVEVCEPSEGEIERLIQPFFIADDEEDDDGGVDNSLIAEQVNKLYPTYPDSVTPDDVEKMRRQRPMGILIGTLKAAGMDDAVELVRGEPSDDLIQRTESRVENRKKLEQLGKKMGR